jgi:hypothetical protein
VSGEAVGAGAGRRGAAIVGRIVIGIAKGTCRGAGRVDVAARGVCAVVARVHVCRLGRGRGRERKVARVRVRV